MTEQTSSYHPKKRYGTLCNFIFTMLFKMILLSLLAWCLLLFWFSIRAIDKGTDIAAHDVNLLLKNHIEWIASRHLPIGYNILLKGKLAADYIQDNTHHVLEYISSLLQKIHQRTLLNMQTVLAVMAILVETAEIVIDRIFIFILSLPLWASLLFVMVVDGLVQRDIRKFQAARESTFLFHWLKQLTGKVFYSFFLIYMSMPWAIQPQTLLLPMALIVSTLVMLSIKHYKKYV